MEGGCRGVRDGRKLYSYRVLLGVSSVVVINRNIHNTYMYILATQTISTILVAQY